jgi:site-specific DNA-methyltransferase (adenine-specific)
MERNKVFHGDCLEMMCDIPDKSVDMILCDLPYGSLKCAWDVVIPFEPLWEQYKRVIKPNGAIVLFGNEPFSSALRMSNIKQYKYDWYWKKGSSKGNFLNSKKQPLRTIENIIVFNANGVYSPVGLKPYDKVVRRGRIDDFYESKYAQSNFQKFTGYPTEVLDYNKDSVRQHPTQKPVVLCEYLIRTYTNEGETVLDNCAGSGTTGVACQNTGRNYILIEKEQKYIDIIKTRLEDNAMRMQQNTLF